MLGRRATACATVVSAIALQACGQAGPEFEPVSFEETDPVQVAIAEDAPVIRLQPDVWLRPRATYALDAYAMSRKKYSGTLLGDELSDLVPLDFALAWGPAARASVQAGITVRQSGRWYYWRAPAGAQLPLSPGQLNANMANVHIIPADDQVLGQLEGVERGRCYRFQGSLVDIEGTDPRMARQTSMSRTDSGAGACEILRVERVREIACPVG